MKNKIIRYLIVLISVIAILFAFLRVISPSKKMNTYLAIGDYLSVSGNLKGEEIISFSSLLGDYFTNNNLVSNVNLNYTSYNVDSYTLLEMINKDAYSGEDRGLVSLIKDSKYITISVGMNDIIEYIRFDSNKQQIVYDKEFIKRKLEIMKQNYYEIIDEIQSLNGEVCVYLLSYYCPFNLVDEQNRDNVSEVFAMLNESVKDVSVLMGVNYVDISNVSEEENMFSKTQIYLNQFGQNNVFTNIKNTYFKD